MNYNQVKALYTKIGLSDAEQQERFSQINMMTRQNSKQDGDRKAFGMIFDHDPMYGNVSNDIPLLAKDKSEATRMRMAMDADPQFNIPSSGVPQVFTTIWTNKAVKQLFKATTASELTSPWQQGAPGVQEIQIPVEAFAGDIEPYSDFTMGGNNSANFNWVGRPVGYFQTSLTYGDMQQAQFGLAKIDYAAKKREAQAVNVSQWQNDLNFNGYTGVPGGQSPRIFGILNEPNLNAAFTLPADGVIPGTATNTTSWIGKDFVQITRDIRLFFEGVITGSQGLVSYDTPAILGVPPSAYIALSTPNAIGSMSVAEFIKTTYPALKVVQIPNFETELAGQTVGMLIMDHPTEGKPYSELFVTKWMGHRPVPMSTSVSEKVSFGMGGVVLKYPFLVSHCYGI